MKTSRLKYPLLAALVLVAGIDGSSQTQQKKVPTEVISVEKGYNPTVKQGKKVDFSPEATPSAGNNLPVSYKSGMENPQFDLGVQPVEALLAEGTVPNSIYPNYVKAAAGYNESTFLEGYYNRSFGKTSVNASVNHDRSVRDVSPLKDNSIFSVTDVSAGIKHALKKYDIGAYAEYSYNAFTNNGTRLNREAYTSALPEVLRHNGIMGGVYLRSNSGLKVFDRLSIEASYMNGANKTNDSYVKAAAGFYIPVRKVTFSLDLSAAYYDNKAVYGFYDIRPAGAADIENPATSSTDFTHLGIVPGVSYKNDRFEIYAGVRMETISGDHVDGTNFHIMPDVKVAYSIIEGLMSVYGRLESGYRVNDMRTMINDNPFASPASGAYYSHDKFKAQVGLSGVISSSVRYDISASYSQTDGDVTWENNRFYMLDNSYLSYYTSTTDNIKLFTLKASVDYTINPSHRIGIFAQYNNSDSERFSKALYTPDFRGGASYKGSLFSNHLDIYGRLAYNSSSRALFTYFPTSVETGMDGYVEYQANATYNINNRWGVFVEANNTIDGRSPRFLYYKAPGFRGMAGVRFNF